MGRGQLTVEEKSCAYYRGRPREETNVADIPSLLAEIHFDFRFMKMMI
jgi:hypothetical protein